MTGDRVYIAPGELRPDHLKYLHEQPATDVLIAAPGLLPVSFDGQARMAREPHLPMPAAQSHAFLRAALQFFSNLLDELPQSVEWHSVIQKWIKRIDEKDARFFHYDQQPLFSHLISTADRSVFIPGPLTFDIAERKDPLAAVLNITGAPHLEARQWFEQRRTDSEDISSIIREILASSWAGDLISPDMLYYKILSDYFRDTLQGMDLENDDNPMLDHLTEFQIDAYQYAKGILRRFGGVLLADVVGLGKTYIAVALLKHLQDSYGQYGIVVAPPAVCPAWNEIAAEFKVELQTVSYGRLEELDDYTGRQILVLDESHNLRNPSTQRYERLQSWVRPDGGASDKRVILLSATPQNNCATDLLHQLRLFPDTYAPLPFRGESLEAYFRSVALEKEALTNLLQHIVVRRTRHFIQAEYPQATIRRRLKPSEYIEEPLVFPRRVSGPQQCLRYSIEATYGEDLYDKIIAALATMEYPLQGIAGYVLREHENDTRLSGVRRAGTSLRGLFKVLLLKRLESSAHALRLSLDRLRERLLIALNDLDQGKVFIRAPLDGEDADDDESVVMPASMFDRVALTRALAGDLERVATLQAACAVVTLGHDAKLARLKEYLASRDPRQHRTIVFTQFADTAQYLYSKLTGHGWNTELVTGSTGNARTAARRFAPKANRATVALEGQIDLLISTDTLSEGVNLQDADTLVNYDLHWNPVRLIQRAGRIDRIGSTNDEIHIASFLPERGLESGLKLEAVLRARISEFMRVFGEDSTVLPSDEILTEESAVSAYSGKAIEDADSSDEMDGLGRHVERILALRRENPVRYASVMAMRPGRHAISAAKSAGICAIQLGWFWSFFRSDHGSPLAVPDLEGLDLLYQHSQAGDSSERDRASLIRVLGDLVEACRREFGPVAEVVRAQRCQPTLDPAEEWIISTLSAYRANCHFNRKPLVDDAIKWVLAGQYKYALRRPSRLWRRENLTGEPLFHELHRLAMHHPIRPHNLDEIIVSGAVVGNG